MASNHVFNVYSGGFHGNSYKALLEVSRPMPVTHSTNLTLTNPICCEIPDAKINGVQYIYVYINKFEM